MIIRREENYRNKELVGITIPSKIRVFISKRAVRKIQFKIVARSITQLL